MKRMRYLALVMVLVMLLSVGCSSSGGEAPGAEAPSEAGSEASTPAKTTLVYGVGVDATTMDPHFANNTPTGNVSFQVHENLTAFDDPKTMKPVGKLAKDWKISEDGLTWTFNLREGITFHDGAPFNAEAVKKNFDRILNPDLGAPRRSNFKMIDRLEVVDEYTVNIITNVPYAALPQLLTCYNASILSPKATEEYGDQYSAHASGTGPFKLGEWIPGESMTLDRNDNYWGEKPSLEKLVFKIIPEDASRVMAVQTGEVDYISNVPPFEIENLKSSGDVTVEMHEGFRTIYLGMVINRPPFDNIKVRQALNYAIDRDAIINDFLEGSATYAIGPEATSIPGASSDLFKYTYDPEKAKALLAEAGYPDGFEIRFVSPHGRYIMDRQIAEAIQAQLSKVGIKANLQILDFSLLLNMLPTGKDAELMLMGKGSPASDPDFDLTNYFTTDGTNNWYFISDPKIDELTDKQRATMDLNERYEVLQELQEKVQEELPWASLHYERQIVALGKGVAGVTVWPYEYIDFSKAKFE
ncbi:MAG TPA: glutathione ABC transporter substrate-binding protein [Bacillota bacterium]|nr:glutathione ABC transporter substrate-binding protein [Bacillota bacterium]